MLNWIRDKIPFRRLMVERSVDASGENEGAAESVSRPGVSRPSGGFPIRWNLIIIAFFIALLNGGIMYLTYVAINATSNGEAGNNQFIIGALIGLLPTGITGLVGLGTTLLNERGNN